MDFIEDIIKDITDLKSILKYKVAVFLLKT